MKPIRIGILTEAKPQIVSGHPRWHEGIYTHLADVGLADFIDIFVMDATSLIRVNPIRLDRIKGWHINGQQFSPIAKPMPEVHFVYNRIATRTYEAKPSVQNLIRSLSRYAPLFNPRFLRKDEIHRALTSVDTWQWWPPTVLLENEHDISDVLSEFDAAYVKPATGSFGYGLMKLTRIGSKWQYVRIMQHSRRPQVGTLSPSMLNDMIHRLYRKESVLIQQAVDSASVNGRPFDLRILMQRDTTYSWKMTGVGGRVAAEGAPTAHTVHGGTVVSFDDLKEAVKVLPDASHLDFVCKTCVETFERVNEITLYEASLDVIVTPNGHPFVLEINSKPYPFDEPTIQRRAAQNFFSLVKRLVSDGRIP